MRQAGWLRSKAMIPLVSWLLLVACLVLTDPLRLPLAALLVPFGLFFVAVRSSLRLLLDQLYKRGSPAKLRLVSTTISVILVFILVLQSLGQLSWQDILLTVSLITATLFYFNKTDLV